MSLRRGGRAPDPNDKVFGQAFFKKLAGDKRGRRPLLCSAARRAVRNAKQKKTVPAKNSEVIFWRPRFTRPLRAGERANANFACSEGFFCARRAAPFAGAAAFSKPAACLPVLAGCAAFLSYFFAFFCLTFASQNSFHLSLRPRRASTFFRKESRQRFAKGLRPFEPHSCALRPIFFSSALLAGLHGPSGRKPPAGRETLEKPRSRAQLFKRFCAKENACALRPISPFLSLLAGLHGPSGRKPPAGKGNARKAKRAELSFSGVSVRWGCAGTFARRVSSRPEETEAQRGPIPGTSRGLARLGKGTNTVRDLPAAGALLAGLQALRAANRRLIRKRPKSQRSRAQLFGRFCAWGNEWPHVLRIHGSLARAFVRQISFWPQGTGVRLFPRPGKQEPGEGHTPGINRVRARLGAYTNTVRDLPAAGAAGKGNARKAKEQSSAFRAFLCVGERLAPRFTYSWKFGAGFCSASSLPATGNRRRVSCLFGKTGAMRGHAPGTNRVRARLSEVTNTVRDLPAAGAAGKGNARKAKGAELSFSGVSVRWGTFGPTFYVFMEVWRGLLSGRFPSGHREQGLGFFPARENRSSAWACTRNQPRACETRGRSRQGEPLCRQPTHYRQQRG